VSRVLLAEFVDTFTPSTVGFCYLGPLLLQQTYPSGSHLWWTVKTYLWWHDFVTNLECCALKYVRFTTYLFVIWWRCVIRLPTHSARSAPSTALYCAHRSSSTPPEGPNIIRVERKPDLTPSHNHLLGRRTEDREVRLPLVTRVANILFTEPAGSQPSWTRFWAS
jgi:hypothetical protein